MSGVFGIIGQQNGMGNLLKSMGQSLTHRPWYQVDVFCDEQQGIGLGRVGIGVFNTETQPVMSEDGKLVLVMAGEFYDEAGLRRELSQKGYPFRDDSHAEFALRLYQEWGQDFVKAVEGIFVIALWDRTRHQLLIVNDRFGFRPLYYAHFNNKFVFAPEMKGILADPGFPKTLNLTAMAEYIRFHLLLGDKSFFEGMTLLPPATCLCIEEKSLQITRQAYWSWNDIPRQERELREEEIAEEAERLLRRAVNIRLERAKRPGIFLSGGLDSRLILALAEPQYYPITTLTYGHHNCRDMRIAARVARTVGTQHHAFELEDGNWVKEVADFHLELTEGAHNWVHAHGMSTLPQARQLIDVNLSGIAGPISGVLVRPEIVQAPDREALINNLFLFYTQQHTWPGLNEGEAASLYTPTYQKLVSNLALDSLKIEVARFDDIDPQLRPLAFHITNRDRRLIANYLIFGNSHFENRCPFYDYKFAEWAIPLPASVKIKKQIHRPVLSRVAPKLALIPYDKDYRLPIDNAILQGAHRLYTKVSRRTKKLFNSRGAKANLYAETLYADYENYVRHELREWTEGILFDERTQGRGIFRREALRSLMDRHLAGHEIHTIGKIAPIMTFEMMMCRFFD